MEEYISISHLNDFIFCPYSIYLHSVYVETDETLFKATPQELGSEAHKGIDKKTGSTRKNDIYSLPVISERLGISGKIDLFKVDKSLLIERKNHLKQIFKGQIYQLWAQYFCMTEMGYKVDNIAFYEISTNKMTHIELPMKEDFDELKSFVDEIRLYNPFIDQIIPNHNKCIHCIYCNLCDKTDCDNVYT